MSKGIWIAEKDTPRDTQAILEKLFELFGLPVEPHDSWNGFRIPSLDFYSTLEPP